MSLFVNPYSFVPMPDEVEREPARTQDRLRPDELSGRIRLTLTAESPVTVGSEALRGSSLHGPVRSLHEALTGSCYRVVDLDFVPGYREPMNVGRRALAVVRRYDETGLWISPPVDGIDVNLRQLQAAAGHNARKIATGARMLLDGAVTQPDHRPHRLSPPATVTFEASGNYVLLVTDVKARRNQDGHWYFHAVEDRAGDVRVDDSVAQRFLHALAGAEDLRAGHKAFAPLDPPAVESPLSGGFDGVPFPNNAGPGNVVAYRRTVEFGDERSLVAGMPVFVGLEGDTVRSVSLAAIWRDAGAGDVRSRLAPGSAPCTTWESACPSCRVFGLADTSGDGKRAGAAEQRSLRGKVRFDDPVLANTVSFESYDLELSSPRPGSGQFYLAPATGTASRQRVWKDDGRRIRGRKFYWATAWEQRGVDPSTGDRADGYGSRLESFAPGTVWTTEVTFQGLTSAELGGLLAALKPSLLGEQWDGARLRLGGGKPYGLGVINTQVDGLELVDLAVTWLGDSPAPSGDDPEKLVSAFRADVPSAAASTWPALQRLLDVDGLGDEASQVHYPEGADGEAFAYWKQWTDAARPGLLPLPVATDANQTMRKP